MTVLGKWILPNAPRPITFGQFTLVAGVAADVIPSPNGPSDEHSGLAQVFITREQLGGGGVGDLIATWDAGTQTVGVTSSDNTEVSSVSWLVIG